MKPPSNHPRNLRNPRNPHNPHAHLLLVDDDRLVLSTLCRELQHDGYAVTSAESMADALALLEG